MEFWTPDERQATAALSLGLTVRGHWLEREMAEALCGYRPALGLASGDAAWRARNRCFTA